LRAEARCRTILIDENTFRVEHGLRQEIRASTADVLRAGEDAMFGRGKVAIDRDGLLHDGHEG
jgi:hypothetical protein